MRPRCETEISIKYRPTDDNEVKSINEKFE